MPTTITSNTPAMPTTTLPMTADGVPLLRLLQLVSPALPVGAYAYSQGLESAVEAGWVANEAAASEWILGLLGHTVAYLDVPLLARLYGAWRTEDSAAVARWTAYLWASRDCAELRAEDRALGVALARLLADLGIDAARLWADAAACTFATLFALAAATWSIPLADAAAGYLWAWCENQVAAAIKLVPLGQTAGQRILSRCAERIPAVVQVGLGVPDADIGSAAPALAIASARHETQYSRLFRS